jgi:multiple sugar transport system substrate-binding protein
LNKKPLIFLSTALSAALLFSAAHLSVRVVAQTNIDLWTKFNDQNPQNTQDQWLKGSLEAFAAETGLAITNTFQPYDQINSKLNVAVQAGGSVPDVSYIDSTQLGFFYQNGTLTDLTDWVTSSGWYNDIEPNALAACTGPDGKIYCVPSTTAAHFMYYWNDFFPDGLPADTDAFLAAAAKLKAEKPDAYAFTGKLAEKAAVERYYYGLILSYGGQVADEEGRAVWANEATQKAVEFSRALFVNGYAAKESLAPGFDNEEPFKRGEAGAFISGSYSYVYLTPLKAPDGTEFNKDITGGFDPKALSVGAANEAGKLGYAHLFSAPGGRPYSVISASAYAIPFGAENMDGAKAYIEWEMRTDNNAEFAVAYGALPTMISSLADEAFQSEYWKAVAKIQADYGVNAPPLIDYDKGTTLLADAIVRLIITPELDIMTELQKAQDEYNAGLE